MKRSAVWLSLGLLACATQALGADPPPSVPTAVATASSTGSISAATAQRTGSTVAATASTPPGPRRRSRGSARPRRGGRTARCARRPHRPPPRPARRDDRPHARPPRSADRPAHGSTRHVAVVADRCSDGVGSECRRRPRALTPPPPLPRPCRRSGARNASSARSSSRRARRRRGAGGNAFRACGGCSATAARSSAGRASRRGRRRASLRPRRRTRATISAHVYGRDRSSRSTEESGGTKSIIVGLRKYAATSTSGFVLSALQASRVVAAGRGRVAGHGGPVAEQRERQPALDGRGVLAFCSSTAARRSRRSGSAP